MFSKQHTVAVLWILVFFLNVDTGSNEQKEHGVYHYGSILFSVLIISSTILMLKKKNAIITLLGSNVIQPGQVK